MVGRRLQPDANGEYPWSAIQPGDFFVYNGHWYGQTPNGLLAGLGNHKVDEHEDGTITVSPSILVNNGTGNGADTTTWHGFLERGIWRVC